MKITEEEVERIKETLKEGSAIIETLQKENKHLRSRSEQLLERYEKLEKSVLIAKYDSSGGNLRVSTVINSDSNKPYETAIAHTNYNHGNWIVVEEYDTKEQAKEGHERWILRMSSSPLPEVLIEVSTCEERNPFYMMEFKNKES